MVFGMEGGVADIPRHDWRSPLRERGRRLAEILGLQHRGIWAMDGRVNDTAVTITESVEALDRGLDALTPIKGPLLVVTIDVRPGNPMGPPGWEGTSRSGWVRRLASHVAPSRRWVGAGTGGLALQAEDARALDGWLTPSRRETLETLAALDGRLRVSRRGLRLRSHRIGHAGSEVERTVRIMITAAERLAS